jgi:hypothetical protein
MLNNQFMDPDPDGRSDKHVREPPVFGDISAEKPFLKSLSHVSPLPVSHQAETGMDIPGSREGYKPKTFGVFTP